MTKTRISSKGQIAIPKSLRERLNLKPGTEVSIDVQGESLVVKRMSGKYPDWRTMEGMARGGGESLVAKPMAGNYPDWRTMRGMARGGESLTKALMEERAAEHAHYDARIQGR